MKLITFCIPCYNSAKYMKKCIDSILVCGDEAEILIIDDGSNIDNTFEIAKEYEKKFPTICRAIHKENGGHGDVLNVGIQKAKGIYFKVVDSDDWLARKNLLKLLDTMRDLIMNGNLVDLFVTNYIYDKVGQANKKVMSYNFPLQKGRILKWKDIRGFIIGNYLMMHSLTYRTNVLRDSKLVLPKHTFYVDNIYAYVPLPYVKTLYYLDVHLYHYYIGREDQSVNQKKMIERIEQQYRVTYLMLDTVDVMKVPEKKLRDYMINYMSIIMTITSVITLFKNDEKWLKEKEKLWKYVKEKNPPLYRRLRHSFLGYGVNLPGKLGTEITEVGYRIVNKIYGFN